MPQADAAEIDLGHGADLGAHHGRTGPGTLPVSTRSRSSRPSPRERASRTPAHGRGTAMAVDVRPVLLIRRPRRAVATFMFDPGHPPDGPPGLQEHHRRPGTTPRLPRTVTAAGTRARTGSRSRCTGQPAPARLAGDGHEPGRYGRSRRRTGAVAPDATALMDPLSACPPPRQVGGAGHRAARWPAAQMVMTTLPRAWPSCRYRMAAGASFSG